MRTYLQLLLSVFMLPCICNSQGRYSLEEIPTEWELPINFAEIGSITPLSDGSLLVVPFTYDFGELDTKTILKVKAETGELIWRKDIRYDKDDFFLVSSSPDVVGFFVDMYLPGSRPSLSLYGIDLKDGSEKWQHYLDVHKYNLGTHEGKAYGWDLWKKKEIELHIVDLSSGERQSAVIAELDKNTRFSGTSAKGDLLFAFEADKINIYEPDGTHQVIQYPTHVNSSVPRVLLGEFGYLIALGESIYLVKENELEVIPGTDPGILDSKYKNIQDLATQAEMTVNDVRLNRWPEAKKEKQQWKVELFKTARESYLNDYMIANLVVEPEMLLVDVGRPKDHQLFLYDSPSLAPRGNMTVSGLVNSNLVEVDSKLYFTAGAELTIWDRTSGNASSVSLPEEMIAMGGDNVLDDRGNRIVISGECGTVTYDISTGTMQDPLFFKPSIPLSLGHYKSRLSITNSRFTGRFNPSTTATGVVIDNRWRAQVKSMDAQIQQTADPSTRAILMDVRSVQMTMGQTFDRINASVSSTSAISGLYGGVQVGLDKTNVNGFFESDKKMLDVLGGQFQNRLDGNYYVLPIFEQSWHFLIVDLNERKAVVFETNKYNELQNINNVVIPSYWLDGQRLVFRVQDQNGEGYQKMSYYKSSKGMNAAGKEPLD